MMLLGYFITLAVLASFAALVAFAVSGRKELLHFMRGRVNRYSLLALVGVLVFFTEFSVLLVTKAAGWPSA